MGTLVVEAPALLHGSVPSSPSCAGARADDILALPEDSSIHVDLLKSRVYDVMASLSQVELEQKLGGAVVRNNTVNNVWASEKNDHSADLEARVEALQKEVKALREENAALRSENAVLRDSSAAGSAVNAVRKSVT